MAQLIAMQKEVRTDSLRTDMCRERLRRRRWTEIDSNAEAAMFAPSVRPCLSVLCLGGRGGVFPG